MGPVAPLLPASGRRGGQWRERFLAEGRDGLLDRPRRGRPPKLDADDLDWLQQALERNPQDHGLLVTIWSIRELQALMQRERGVDVSVYTLHRVMQALGYRYSRLRHDLRHRQDADAVAAAKRMLDWLEKSVAQPDRPELERPHLVYVDECEIHTHPNLAKVWRKKGQPMRIAAAGEDQKCAVFGAVDYAGGQVIFQMVRHKGERCLRGLSRPVGASLPRRRIGRGRPR